MTESPASSSEFALKRVEISGYRGFDHVEFDLGPMNVLVGVNGSGKSSALMALSLVLEEVARSIGPVLRKGRLPDGHEFFGGGTRCSIQVQINALDTSYLGRVSYKCQQAKTTRLIQSTKHEAIELGKLLFEGLESKSSDALPILAFYPVSRAVNKIPLRVREKASHSWLGGYLGAFSSERDFALFFQWFREQEDAENEIRVSGNSSYRDPLLQAIRVAVTQALPGYSDIRVQRRPRLRMVLNKAGKTTSIQQMSDGERGVITLVGDIARRACLLNPSLADPLCSPGVVLIDEIEQHLHPQWQRHLVQTLPKVFPNVQFVLSTHSPVVCNSVQPDQLLVVSASSVKVASAYGWSVQDTLKAVFDLDDRPAEINRQLLELDKALDAADVVESQRLVEELGKILPGTDQELVRAKVILPFLLQAEDNEKS